MAFSGNVTAVLGKNLASSLGRKGTCSDITLYNYKIQDTVLSFVEPSSYPDRIQSLVSSLNMANQVLLKITELNAFFAETLVTLDAAGVTPGYLILDQNIMHDSVKNLVPHSIISSYPVIEEQVMTIREKLAQLNPGNSGDAVIQTDHSFTVKGVGTVALGVVKKGTIRKHDEVTIYPSRKKTLIKSVQVHDTDVDEAVCGVRVGLALKDIKPEDVPRGALISTSDSLQTTNSLKLEATLSKYSPRSLNEGDAVMVNAMLNYVPCKVTEGSLKPGETKTISLSLEKDIPLFSGRLMLLDAGQKMPRVFGHGLL